MSTYQERMQAKKDARQMTAKSRAATRTSLHSQHYYTDRARRELEAFRTRCATAVVGEVAELVASVSNNLWPNDIRDIVEAAADLAVGIELECDALAREGLDAAIGQAMTGCVRKMASFRAKALKEGEAWAVELAAKS